MTDIIDMGKDGKILPLKTLFEKKIFHRNYDTGDLELDLTLLKLYELELYDYFIDKPEDFISLAKTNIKEIFDMFPEKKDKDGNVEEASALPKNIINFKIINFNEEFSIARIRNKDVNKICRIKGIIKRITKPVTRAMAIEYECIDCGTKIKILQDTKKIILPTRCACGNKNQTRFREGKKEIRDIQELSLEEFPEETAGKQPHQIRVYVEGDLTEPDFSERLQPGKRIEIIGIIKPIPPFMTKNDVEENISEFMFFAVNINHLEEDSEQILCEEDIDKIKEIACNNPLEQLSNNLAPGVYGNDYIKKAIVLQLAKGVKKRRPDGTFTRGDLHILLCGDPGLAKSVLLKTTSLRSPNSRYISGTRSSSVGLTASLKRDELLQTWAIEAGVIVLCNKSIVCLDELEKMDKEQLSGLYEPLEGQTVSISKTVSATLQAETSILAAANPIKGKFDVKQPLSTQIDLPPPLLNRFDLIFILIDRVEEKRDRESVQHLFKVHSGELTKIENEIPIPLFRKYIAYVRKLEPKLNIDLSKKIENIYWDIRKESLNQDGVPINFRNIEGLIRLAEAHAKIRLSETVEEEDIDVAEKILKFSLSQLAYDESGVFDMSRMTEKVPVTKRGRMEKVMFLVQELYEKKNECKYEDLKVLCLTQDIQQWEMNNFIEQLKREGQLFEPRKGEYKIV